MLDAKIAAQVNSVVIFGGEAYLRCRKFEN